MDAFSTASVLNRMPMFRHLESEQLYLLSRHTREINATKGQRLFNKGEQAEGFYYVLDGKIKLAFVSSRGTEKIVDIVAGGENFGESMMLSSQPWPYYAQVLLQSRLLYIKGEAFTQVVHGNPRVAQLLLTSMSRRVCHLFADMEALCLQSSRERVVGYLLREIEQQRQRGETDLTIELPDTKANTASLLNLTPETFSRIIHTLDREKTISVSRRTVTVLDLERLQEGCGC